MARGPDDMVATVARRLPETTGRSLTEWIALLEARLPDAGFTERQAYLMSEHGLERGQARTIVHVAAYETRPPDEELVAAQYTGSKAALRPVYEAVIAAATALGDDVDVAPRRTYVTLARARQFGVVQASTRTRVDLGLRLDGVPASGRLGDAGSFGSGSITHRIALAAPAEVDAEVRGRLRDAYTRAAAP